MKTNIPVANRVLVKLPVDTKDKTVGGIHIPQASVEKSSEGTVLATGPQTKEIFVGDRVLLPKHGGVPVKLDGSDYVLIAETEVLMVLSRHEK